MPGRGRGPRRSNAGGGDPGRPVVQLRCSLRRVGGNPRGEHTQPVPLCHHPLCRADLGQQIPAVGLYGGQPGSSTAPPGRRRSTIPRSGPASRNAAHPRSRPATRGRTRRRCGVARSRRDRRRPATVERWTRDLLGRLRVPELTDASGQTAWIRDSRWIGCPIRSASNINSVRARGRSPPQATTAASTTRANAPKHCRLTAGGASPGAPTVPEIPGRSTPSRPRGGSAQRGSRWEGSGREGARWESSGWERSGSPDSRRSPAAPRQCEPATPLRSTVAAIHPTAAAPRHRARATRRFSRAGQLRHRGREGVGRRVGADRVALDDDLDRLCPQLQHRCAQPVGALGRALQQGRREVGPPTDGVRGADQAGQHTGGPLVSMTDAVLDQVRTCRDAPLARPQRQPQRRLYAPRHPRQPRKCVDVGGQHDLFQPTGGGRVGLPGKLGELSDQPRGELLPASGTRRCALGRAGGTGEIPGQQTAQRRRQTP